MLNDKFLKHFDKEGLKFIPKPLIGPEDYKGQYKHEN